MHLAMGVSSKQTSWTGVLQGIMRQTFLKAVQQYRVMSENNPTQTTLPGVQFSPIDYATLLQIGQKLRAPARVYGMNSYGGYVY